MNAGAQHVSAATKHSSPARCTVRDVNNPACHATPRLQGYGTNVSLYATLLSSMARAHAHTTGMWWGGLPVSRAWCRCGPWCPVQQRITPLSFLSDDETSPPGRIGGGLRQGRFHLPCVGRAPLSLSGVRTAPRSKSHASLTRLVATWMSSAATSAQHTSVHCIDPPPAAASALLPKVRVCVNLLIERTCLLLRIVPWGWQAAGSTQGEPSEALGAPAHHHGHDSSAQSLGTRGSYPVHCVCCPSARVSRRERHVKSAPSAPLRPPSACAGRVCPS
jgi:hypothetical protein